MLASVIVLFGYDGFYVFNSKKNLCIVDFLVVATV